MRSGGYGLPWAELGLVGGATVAGFAECSGAGKGGDLSAREDEVDDARREPIDLAVGDDAQAAGSPTAASMAEPPSPLCATLPASPWGAIRTHWTRSVLAVLGIATLVLLTAIGEASFSARQWRSPCWAASPALS